MGHSQIYTDLHPMLFKENLRLHVSILQNILDSQNCFSQFTVSFYHCFFNWVTLYAEFRQPFLQEDTNEACGFITPLFIYVNIPQKLQRKQNTLTKPFKFTPHSGTTFQFCMIYIFFYVIISAMVSIPCSSRRYILKTFSIIADNVSRIEEENEKTIHALFIDNRSCKNRICKL